MSADYYVFADQQYGPYDAAAIRGLAASGRLDGGAWVFHEGETPEWTRATEVASIKAFFPVAPSGQGGALRVPFAKKFEQAQATSQVPPPKEVAATVLAPPDAAGQVRKMEVNLPSAPLSDMRRPYESIQVPPPMPPPTPGRWFDVLQKIFGRKSPS